MTGAKLTGAKLKQILTSSLSIIKKTSFLKIGGIFQKVREEFTIPMPRINN